ncbi:DUF4350 domain-containing protein [Arthrobacter sp. zg-Y1171]|uniref:DUF4350 domain-containing protein n=1 Tax=unclassified Arthrobacter TaxID=235627 RepID=UPI0021041E0F|nr:DUF4350 domain-containing protein [Arthrobacter sp. zg-Y1171]MCQ1945412.1 DUF4350 domain-containing protein [Arthrobacter sp. zg-Y1116]MCQ1994927.1 DUF4350 domain-containing protein [Arthrobacter sp. zg-Y1171]UWX81010.1 DUF4350 domain-containing protein [Arthrobacter sp. zg-Y1171]
MSRAASEAAPAGGLEASGGNEEPGQPRSRGRFTAWLRRHRVPLLLLLLLCAVVVASVWGRADHDTAALSPANPAPDGAMAAAEILADRGVDVQHHQTMAEALAALEDNPGATLLFLDPSGFLTGEQRQDLADAAGRVVLVEPSFEQLADFAPEIRSAGLLPEDPDRHRLDAGCGNRDAEAAGAVEAGGKTYRGPVTCFPAPGSQGTDAAGSYAATTSGSAVVLGSADLIANESVAREGNAALAFRTLGADDTLVWYQAGPFDVPPSEAPADPFSLLPAWVNPLLFWLLLVACAAAFWRGRRLGPLMEEPLPVIVHAAETAEGRARLYQDSQAVAHAAATLRAAALTRLAAHLRVGPGAGVDTVTRATANASGRSYSETDHLLNQRLPGTGAELVRWARDLKNLEEEATSS